MVPDYLSDNAWFKTLTPREQEAIVCACATVQVNRILLSATAFGSGVDSDLIVLSQTRTFQSLPTLDRLFASSRSGMRGNDKRPKATQMSMPKLSPTWTSVLHVPHHCTTGWAWAMNRTEQVVPTILPGSRLWSTRRRRLLIGRLVSDSLCSPQ